MLRGEKSHLLDTQSSSRERGEPEEGARWRRNKKIYWGEMRNWWNRIFFANAVKIWPVDPTTAPLLTSGNTALPPHLLRLRRKEVTPVLQKSDKIHSSVTKLLLFCSQSANKTENNKVQSWNLWHNLPIFYLFRYLCYCYNYLHYYILKPVERECPWHNLPFATALSSRSSLSPPALNMKIMFIISIFYFFPLLPLWI